MTLRQPSVRKGANSSRYIIWQMKDTVMYKTSFAMASYFFSRGNDNDKEKRLFYTRCP